MAELKTDDKAGILNSDDRDRTIARLQARNAELQQAHDKLASENTALKTAEEDLHTKIDAHNMYKAELELRISDLESEKAHAEEAETTMRTIERGLTERYDEVVAQNLLYEKRVATLESERAEADKEASKWRRHARHIDQRNSENWEARLELEKRVAELRDKFDGERQDRDAAETELKTVRAKLNKELEAQKEASEDNENTLRMTIARLQVDVENLTEEASHYKAGREEEIKEVAISHEKIQELTADLEAAQEEAKKDKVILEERYQGYIRAVSDRDEARLRGKQLRIECEKQRKEIQELIYLRDEAIRTGKTYVLEDHAGLVQYEDDEVREPSEEEKVAKTWREAANNSVQELVDVKSRNAELAAEVSAQKERIDDLLVIKSDLEGKLEGERQDRDAVETELKAEIDDLKMSKPPPVERINELDLELAEERKHIDSLVDQLKDVDGVNTDLRHKLFEANKQLIDLGKERKSEEERNVRLVSQNKDLESINTELRHKLQEANKRIDEKDAHIEACDEDMERMRSKIEDNPEIKVLQNAKGHIQQQRDEAREEISKKQVQIDSLEEMLKNARGDSVKLAKRIDVLNSEHVTELDELIGELEVKRDELKTLSEKFEESLKEQKSLEEKVANLTAESDSMSNSEANARRHWDIAFRACAGYQDDIAKFKNSHEASKHEIDRLNLKIKSLEVANEMNENVIKELREKVRNHRNAAAGFGNTEDK